jgi:excisionase family DNA binding protein
MLTLPEAMARLRVSRRTLFRLIATGRIRTVHPTPGRTMVTEREVAAYLAALEGRRVA